MGKHPHRSNRRRRFALAIGLPALAIAGCQLVSEHMKQACAYLDQACLFAARKAAWHEGEVGVSFGKQTTVIHRHRLFFAFDQLRKIDKGKDAGAHRFQPTIAVAPDPSYRGAETIAVGDARLAEDGADVPLRPDAAALAALNAQRRANWSLLRAALPVVVDGNPRDVVLSASVRYTGEIVPGRPFRPAMRYLMALRDRDGAPFAILGEVFHFEPGVFARPTLLPDTRGLHDLGKVRAQVGTDVALPDAAVWNPTSSAFAGTWSFCVRRGNRETALVARKFQVGAYGVHRTGAVRLPTAGLPAGEYLLVGQVLDANGKDVTEHRWTMQLVGPQPWVEFEGLQRSISARAGGAIGTWIRAGAGDAGQPYLVALSLTASLHGTVIGGLRLPFGWDSLSSAGLGLLGTPAFADGLGLLDGRGFAKTTLRIPAHVLSGCVGKHLLLAPVVAGSAPRSAGRPWSVEVTP